MPSRPMSAEARLARAIQLVPETGCWEWQLKKDRAGYGRLIISHGKRGSGKSTSAHRFAYQVMVGPIPDGMNVLHKCDNRACCNPSHLFIGTQRDNMRDMHAKGRGPRGYSRDAAICAANAKQRGKGRATYAELAKEPKP